MHPDGLERTYAVTRDDGAQGGIATYLHRAVGRPRGILQVLVHGVSYDHRYWNADAVDGEDSSYCRFMADRGYDVLAVDLPGVGRSVCGPGDEISMRQAARGVSSVVNQISTAAGPLERHPRKIVLVGHSVGNTVIVATQAMAHSADLLILTGSGFNSARSSPFSEQELADAMTEPDCTFRAETRHRVFYHPPTADPDVIVYDNCRLRTTFPRSLWREAGVIRADRELSGIGRVECPVYMQLGDHDPIMPSALAGAERAAWPDHVDLTVEGLDDIGHSFNLHRTRKRGWLAVLAHLDARL